MLWPEGSAHRFRDLDEPFVAFTVSKPGYYVAACTTSQISMYRVKPLAPVSLYTLHTTDGLPLLGLRHSPLGNRLVTWTHAQVIEFDVVPVGYVSELARISQSVTPGPGEAVGTRELYLKEVSRYDIEHSIIDVICVESGVFVVGPEMFTKLGEKAANWSTFNGIDFRITSTAVAPLLNKAALVSENGAVRIVSLTEPDREAIEVCPRGAIRAAFNMRQGKLTIATEFTIFLHSLDRDDSAVIDFAHGMPDISHIQWASQGNAIIVASAERWSLLSALGMPIYTSPPGNDVSHSEWSLGSDELFLLGSSGLYVYNILRWTGLGSLSRPVLYSSSRLHIFHDGQKSRLSANPWLLVPIPAFYMAENWPLMYVSCSADGKYVAAAGSTGLVHFSVSSRNWKELSDHDMKVRGGIVWYGRVLVVAADVDGSHVLQMYSPVSILSRRDSSVAVPTHKYAEDEHVIASLTLDARVIAMSLWEDYLAVLLPTGLKILDLTGNQLNAVEEWRLSGVILTPWRVRSIDLLAKDKLLVFVDDQLVSLTKKGNGVYKKQVLADSIEYYSIDHQNLWLFDGHELSLHLLDNEVPEAPGPQFKVHQDGIYFKVDGYPVAINPSKGVIATIEAHGLSSKDGSFTYIKPTAHIQVYLLHLLEPSLEQLPKFTHLDYYDQVVQTLLNRALVNDSQLADMLSIIKRTAKSWRHVVASCARKVETKYWPKLFHELGQTPAQLFDDALADGDLVTAAEFLMVVHADKESKVAVAAGGPETQRLFKAAFNSGKHDLCRDVCEFLLAVDESGQELARFKQQL
ncbi:Guanine nucleotide exchange factor subunit Rich [Wickerhamiella sorbophila]|uniref:Guanine nucleotide exchange factor subunit Rich n=1 Tax=Wickerhamiella sorbophila TaxID=45607 RepID=A0A2T0FFD9_9ASCO|nr:Guanine nucleotide exchange factor subunit Rich [Wickerhamiella sorbophila]PRT53713.1 Guanine nucleotide exchange factor subunit Rich [Wickerhamiella sorbophila]